MWQEAYYNCFLPYRSFVEDVRTIWQMVNILHVAHQPQRVLDVFEEYRSKLLLRLASPGVATAAQPFALSEGDYGSPLLSMKDNNASVSSILEVSEEVAKEEARRQTLVAVGEAANELGRWDVALQLYEVAMGEWLRRCSCSVPRYYSNNVGAKGGAVAYSDDSKSYALHVPLSSCVFCSTVSSSAQSLLSEAITDANKRNKRVPRDAAVATAISPSMASLELVQQLLENALHTLRRVKRYAHVLELYHAWGGAAAVAAPERSVRGGIADDTLALLWTPRALGFVAQVALATDNVSLLLEMTGVLDDSDEGNHRNSRSYPRVGTATRAMIPVDVYDAALRAVQVRIARGELHKQQQQLGKKEKGIEDVKAAVVQAESGADWEVLSEKVYTKYLRDAINELHQKQQQQARVLATPVHAPLIRLVMNLQEEAAASCIHLGEDRLSLKRQHFHASQADAWQAALQHFHNTRHPDAILVTLTTDVLYRSAFSSSAAAARCLDIHTAAMNVGGRSPASQNSCWEAAFEVFNSLLKHAAPRGQRQGLATTHSSAAPSPSCVMDLTVVSAAAVQRGVRSASAHPYAALSLLQTAIMYCWLSTPAATNVRETMISSSGGGSGIAAQLIKELQDISMRHAKEDIATVEDSLLVADGATASKAPSCVIPFLTEAEAAAAATGRLVALLYTLYHQPQRHSVTPLARASATLSPPTAWGDVMSAAIQLMEQLREHGQPATAAMSQLLGTLHAAWRQCVKEEKEEEEKKGGLVRGKQRGAHQGQHELELMTVTIVNAVLLRLCVATASRWALWPQCLELLGFLQAPDTSSLSVGPDETAHHHFVSTGPERSTAKADAETLRALSLFVLCCDTAETGFVESLITSWLLPECSCDPASPTTISVPLPENERTEKLKTESGVRTSQQCAAALANNSVQLVLNAVMWACRHRNKILALRLHRLASPAILRVLFSKEAHAMSTRCEATVSRGKDAGEEKIEASALVTQVVVLQTLTSGPANEVLRDWSYIYSIVTSLGNFLCVHRSRWRAREEEESFEGTRVEAWKQAAIARVVALLDSMTAIAAKLQRTLHDVLVQLSLDTHRSHTLATTRDVLPTRITLEVGVVEQTAHEFVEWCVDTLLQGLLLPWSTIVLKQHTYQQQQSRRQQQQQQVSMYTMEMNLLKKCVAKAVAAAWDVTYSHHVWLACFKVVGVENRKDLKGKGNEKDKKQQRQQEGALSLALAQVRSQARRILYTEVNSYVLFPASCVHEAQQGTLTQTLAVHVGMWCTLASAEAVVASGSDSSSSSSSTSSDRIAAVAASISNDVSSLASLGTVFEMRVYPSGWSSSRLLPSELHERQQQLYNRQDRSNSCDSAPVSIATSFLPVFMQAVHTLTEDLVHTQSSMSVREENSNTEQNWSSSLSGAAEGRKGTPLPPSEFLPPISDDLTAANLFSFSSAHRRPFIHTAAQLAVLHDTAHHLLHVTLCEGGEDPTSLLLPLVAKEVKSEDGSLHKPPRAPTMMMPLMHSALAWRCSSLGVYSAVLRAVEACTAAAAPGFLVWQSPLVRSSAKRRGGGVLADPEALSRIFESMTAISLWYAQRHAETLTTVAATTCRKHHFREDFLSNSRCAVALLDFAFTVREGQAASGLTENVAAEALFFLAVGIYSGTQHETPEGISFTTACGAELLTQVQEAAVRLVQAFPGVVVHVCLPRVLHMKTQADVGTATATQHWRIMAASMSHLMKGILASKTARAHAARRAAVAWLLVVDGSLGVPDLSARASVLLREEEEKREERHGKGNDGERRFMELMTSRGRLLLQEEQQQRTQKTEKEFTDVKASAKLESVETLSVASAIEEVLNSFVTRGAALTILGMCFPNELAHHTPSSPSSSSRAVPPSEAPARNCHLSISSSSDTPHMHEGCLQCLLRLATGKITAEQTAAVLERNAIKLAEARAASELQWETSLALLREGDGCPCWERDLLWMVMQHQNHQEQQQQCQVSTLHAEAEGAQEDLQGGQSVMARHWLQQLTTSTHVPTHSNTQRTWKQFIANSISTDSSSTEVKIPSPARECVERFLLQQLAQYKESLLHAPWQRLLLSTDEQQVHREEEACLLRAILVALDHCIPGEGLRFALKHMYTPLASLPLSNAEQDSERIVKVVRWGILVTQLVQPTIIILLTHHNQQQHSVSVIQKLAFLLRNIALELCEAELVIVSAIKQNDRDSKRTRGRGGDAAAAATAASTQALALLKEAQACTQELYRTLSTAILDSPVVLLSSPCSRQALAAEEAEECIFMTQTTSLLRAWAHTGILLGNWREMYWLLARCSGGISQDVAQAKAHVMSASPSLFSRKGEGKEDQQRASADERTKNGDDDVGALVPKVIGKWLWVVATVPLLLCASIRAGSELRSECHAIVEILRPLLELIDVHHLVSPSSPSSNSSSTTTCEEALNALLDQLRAIIAKRIRSCHEPVVHATPHTPTFAARLIHVRPVLQLLWLLNTTGDGGASNRSENGAAKVQGTPSVVLPKELADCVEEMCMGSTTELQRLLLCEKETLDAVNTEAGETIKDQSFTSLKVEEAVRCLQEASKVELEVLVKWNEETQTATGPPAVLPSSSHQGGSGQVTVREAWHCLKQCVLAAPRRQRQQKQTTAGLRNQQNSQLLSALLAVKRVPHTPHLFPLSVSEALMTHVCEVWSDALTMLEASLTTLQDARTYTAPIVQENMALLLLKRVRAARSGGSEDASFRWGLQEYTYESKYFPLHSSGPTELQQCQRQCSPLSMHKGDVALAGRCYDLLVSCDGHASGASGQAGKLRRLGHRVFVEVLRASVYEPQTAHALYETFWDQQESAKLQRRVYQKLDGPHVFLSLLRAARIAKEGDLALEAMADYLACSTGDSALADALQESEGRHLVKRHDRQRMVMQCFSTESDRAVWKAFVVVHRMGLIDTNVADLVVEHYKRHRKITEVEELMVTAKFSCRTPEARE